LISDFIGKKTQTVHTYPSVLRVKKQVRIVGLLLLDLIWLMIIRTVVRIMIVVIRPTNVVNNRAVTW